MDKNLEPQSKVSARDLMGTKNSHEDISNGYSGAGTFRGQVLGNNEEKSNQCNQCDFTSLHAGSFSRHLKVHTGEK